MKEGSIQDLYPSILPWESAASENPGSCLQAAKEDLDTGIPVVGSTGCSFVGAFRETLSDLSVSSQQPLVKVLPRSLPTWISVHLK